MSEAQREVRLPADLCQRAEERFVGATFETLEDLVRFVLEELVQDEAQQMDEAEERIIEQRLRDLGYV